MEFLSSSEIKKIIKSESVDLDCTLGQGLLFIISNDVLTQN